MRKCYFCKEIISSTVTIGYSTECPFCSKPLKICFNCRHYDPSAYHQCKEGVEERILDKDRPNFCDYFVMGENSANTKQKSNQEARSNFLSLFNNED